MTIYRKHLAEPDVLKEYELLSLPHIFFLLQQQLCQMRGEELGRAVVSRSAGPSPNPKPFAFSLSLSGKANTQTARIS